VDRGKKRFPTAISRRKKGNGRGEQSQKGSMFERIDVDASESFAFRKIARQQEEGGGKSKTSSTRIKPG